MRDRTKPSTSSATHEHIVPTTSLLLPIYAVLELALFVIGVLAVSWVYPAFDLRQIEPNPCWLAVLLLSVQYGAVSGLLAAGVSIALSLYFGFPEQDVGENLFVHLLRVWAQPMLWITSAVILGQFRTRHMVERRELARELAKISSQRSAIARHAEGLRARCDALERHIGGRDTGEPLQVLAALARAGSPDETDLQTTLDELIAAALPGAATSIYLLSEDRLERVAGSKVVGAVKSPDALKLDAALAKALLRDQHVVSVLTPDGEQLLGSDCVAAAPISDEAGTFGILVVETAPAHLMTRQLPQGLSVVAAALAGIARRSMTTTGGPAANQTRPSQEAGSSGGWMRRLWLRPATAPAPATALPLSTGKRAAR